VNRIDLLIALAILVALPISRSLAQTPSSAAEPKRLSEVTVTADAANRALANLPASATVLESLTLSERGDQHLQDTLDYIPNLNYAGGTNAPRFFQIRGIGELEQYEGAPNPSVGMLVDDFDLTGLPSTGVLFDIEQIEVLRGPQSVRFGTSGLAGIINMKYAEPTAYQMSHAEFTTGSDDLFAGGAAISGPLTEDGTLLYRISAFQNHSNGYRNNSYLSRDNTNDRNEFTGRAELQWNPTRELTFNARFLRFDNNNGYDAFTVDNTLTTRSDQPGKDDQSLSGGLVKATYQMDPDTTFTSTTQVTGSDQTYSYDGDWGNNAFWAPYDPYEYFSKTERDRTNFATELRLASQDPEQRLGERVNWLSGLYLGHISEDTFINDSSSGETYRELDSKYDALNTAAFGEVEVPVYRATSAALGLRIEQRDLSYKDSNAAKFSPIDTMLGGHFTVSHDVDDDLRTYGLVSRGFKGGGFNPGTAVPMDRRSYDPEYLWNFEVGVKGDWLNKRLTSNTSIFYDLRRDQQIKLGVQNDPSDPLSFTYLTDNAQSGTTSGMETELNWEATGRLSLMASTGLLFTSLDQLPEELADLEGRETSHSPTWQFATGARYSLTEAIFTRVDVTGKDSFYFDDGNNQKSSAYALVNAAVGWSSGDWSVTVWGHNILDRSYAVRGFYFGQEPPDFQNKRYIQRGNPAQFGVTATVQF